MSFSNDPEDSEFWVNLDGHRLNDDEIDELFDAVYNEVGDDYTEEDVSIALKYCNFKVMNAVKHLYKVGSGWKPKKEKSQKSLPNDRQPSITPSGVSSVNSQKSGKKQQPSTHQASFTSNSLPSDIVSTAEIIIRKQKEIPLPSIPAQVNDALKEKPHISVVVIGHVDSGKSTLMGHLLAEVGRVSDRDISRAVSESKAIGKSSFAYASVMDSSDAERKRGVTIDVGTNYFESQLARYTLLDAPGHQEYIPNMIVGVTQADIAILVLDAVPGAFEAGFMRGGQTREHATLARLLGVRKLVVAVNKMDHPLVLWSEDRFREILKQSISFLGAVGFHPSSVIALPLSGLSGGNISTSIRSSSDSSSPTHGYDLSGFFRDSIETMSSTDPDASRQRESLEEDDMDSPTKEEEEFSIMATMLGDLGLDSSDSGSTGSGSFVPSRGSMEESEGIPNYSWYNGCSLVEALDSLTKSIVQGDDSIRSRQLQKPLRMAVADVYKSPQGLVVSGRIESGWMIPRSSVVSVPGMVQIVEGFTDYKHVNSGVSTDGVPFTFRGPPLIASSSSTVRSINIGGVPVSAGLSGNVVEAVLGGADESNYLPGSLVCWSTHLCPLIHRFKCRIFVLPDLEFPIVSGQQFMLHAHTRSVPCNITALLRTIDRRGHSLVHRPRLIKRSETAVVRIRLLESFPLDIFEDNPRTGRFVLRYGGKTVAGGVVLKVAA